MTYIVRIERGKGKNKSISQSIPLPNKERVSKYIKRNPLVNSNTNIRVTNIKTKKIVTGKEGRFIKNPITKKYRF